MNLNVRVKAAHFQRYGKRMEFLVGLGDIGKQDVSQWMDPVT